MRQLLIVVYIVSVLLISNLNAQQPDAVAIRVVDSSGEHVPNVEAHWYRNGKWKRLSQNQHSFSVPERTGLIVVRADDFQYSGIVLEKLGAANNEIVMLRVTEQGPQLKTLPIPINEQRRQRMTEQFENDLWEQVNNQPAMPVLARSLQTLAAISPEKTLDYLNANQLATPVEMTVKRVLIMSLAKSNVDAAIELADSVEDPMFRQTMLYSLLKNLPVKDPNFATIENQFVETIQTIKQPQLRLAVWASLAEHYINTDRPELAGTIVERHIDDVQKLPVGGWSGYPRSLFAALIVSDNPKLAAEMIEGMDQNEVPRALGRLAFHCARNNPALAIDFLNQIQFGENTITKATYHTRLVHHIAVVQTDGAFAVAETIESPAERGWALGLLAKRLHASNPKIAKQALQSAVEQVEKASKESVTKHFFPSAVMAGLLSIAEKVAPEQAHSMMWQSVYLTKPHSRWVSGGVGSKQAKFQHTAAALARYDTALAKALANGINSSVDLDPNRGFVNLLILDSEKLFASLDELESKRGLMSALSPREKVTKMLMNKQQQFWDEVSLPRFMHWPGDTFENR